MPRKPNERDYAEMRRRNRFPVTFLRERLQREKERMSFLRISHYLHYSEIALVKERYITAMYGCPTSWPKIEAVSIYYNVEHKTVKTT